MEIDAIIHAIYYIEGEKNIIISRTIGIDPHPDPDVQLMLRFKESSDRAIFEQLMKKHYLSILNYIYKFMNNKHAAEDLAQEVFLKIYDKANKYKPTSSFKTWIYTIARNACLNELRRSKFHSDNSRLEEQVDANSDAYPEETAIMTETAAEVQKALGRLPENQRTAVILYRYDELSYLEIANIMNISEKAVKSLLNRGKENLKHLLSHLLE